MKDKPVKICILGGGNIGTLLLGDIGTKDHISLRLFTTKPEKWNKEIRVYNSDDTVKHIGKIDLVSNNPEEVIADADIIISTVPSHIFPEVLDKIKSFIKDEAWIGVMPGSGGTEFFCKDLILKGCILFGFQRVHGVARIKEYGESVYDLGKRPELHIGAIPATKSKEISEFMEILLGIACNPLPNYLNVTLTPSNPILHTTRLYSLFYNYEKEMTWNRMIEFYSEWTDESSRLLIDCDEEVQLMCRKLTGLELADVKSLKEHYESDTEVEMTNKIKSIPAFKGLKSPMIKVKDGYIPDFQSRYFLEDFSYGLCIIKGFCEIANMDVPSIDKVLLWFQKVTGTKYYIKGEFIGEDLQDLPLPQNYGLNTVEDIVSFYK